MHFYDANVLRLPDQINDPNALRLPDKINIPPYLQPKPAVEPIRELVGLYAKLDEVRGEVAEVRAGLNALSTVLQKAGEAEVEALLALSSAIDKIAAVVLASMKPQPVGTTSAPSPITTTVTLPLFPLPAKWTQATAEASEAAIRDAVGGFTKAGALTEEQEMFLYGLLDGRIPIEDGLTDSALVASGVTTNILSTFLSWADREDVPAYYDVACASPFSVIFLYVAFYIEVIGPQIFEQVFLADLKKVLTGN
jgi:hypothetical protein